MIARFLLVLTALLFAAPVEAQTWLNRVQAETAPANKVMRGVDDNGAPIFEDMPLASLPLGGPVTETDYFIGTQSGAARRIALGDLTGGAVNSLLGANSVGAISAATQAQINAISGVTRGKYSDVGAGVNIFSVGDKVLLGYGQSAWTGFTYTPGVTTGTWVLSTLNPDLRYLEKGAQAVIGSRAGGAGVFAFTRQSDNGGGASDPVPIAYAGLVYNDVVGTRGAWGGYFEGHRIQGAGPGIASELEAVNYGSENTFLTPYGARYIGSESRALSYGQGIGCGAGLPSGATRYNCTAALYVTDNGSQFRTGIEFLYDAIAADANGNREAIGMGVSQALIWRYSSGLNAIGGIIRSDNATNSAVAQRLIFEAGALRIKGVLSNLTTEHDLFSVLAPAMAAGQTGVNTFTISPQASDGTRAPGTATLIAAGPDADIDFAVTPKGTGVLALSYAALTATTPASFSATRTIRIRANGVNYYVPAMTTGW